MAVNLFARFATLCTLAVLACGLPSLESRGPDPICKQIEDSVSSASDVYYPGEFLQSFCSTSQNLIPSQVRYIMPRGSSIGLYRAHSARNVW